MATSSRSTGVIDPYSTDDEPLVSVEIDGREISLIERYCYDSDLLQLGDPFSVAVPDPHGKYGWIVEGMPIKLYMASPRVGNGQKVQKVLGVVTQVIRSVDRERGSVITVGGADLGWFLVNCDAPIWHRLTGRTFDGLYDLFVDPSWGFTGFEVGRDRNTRVKLGGNYVRAVRQLGDSDRPPIVQVEPGDKPADYFIQYAKLANKLVNVTYDGKLVLFAPRYDTPIVYKFCNYRDASRARATNNVESAQLTRALDSRYTKAVCVGERILPLIEGVNPNDPNANSFRGTYSRPATGLSGSRQSPLPFTRLVAFADADRLDRAQATARAKWKIQRGDFDAWNYEIVVRGHSQSGNFFEPDTMCEVHDEFFGLDGTFYVTAVRYDRDQHGGTKSTIQIRLANLLAA